MVACYSTASRESALRWLLAAGDKCETTLMKMDTTDEGVHEPLMATSIGVNSSNIWIQPWGQTGKWLRLRQM